MDTLAYAKRLRATGVPEDQAEAHAEALNAALQAEVATKADLKSTEAALRQDLKELDAVLRQELKALEAHFDARLIALETELRLHRWVLGFVVALQIAILAKLFFV